MENNKLKQALEAKALDLLRMKGLPDEVLTDIAAKLQEMDINSMKWFLDKLQERLGEHKWMN